MQQITKDTTLKAMEKNIAEELKGKELWGDIAITEAEYECIRDRINAAIENSSCTIIDICRNYPITVTTFMVFLMRYKYDTNFWGLVSDELNINVNSQIESEIGTYIRKTFTKYSFDFSDVKDERRINIGPILYEAGLPPESSLDDLFYVLSYDSHSIFDPQLIIEDLLVSRSYHIRKPMQRFLHRFQDNRAVEFVLEVHDSMICVDQNRSGSSRYIGKYTNWKAEERTKERGNSRKKQEFQTRPYLAFENGKRGLCMVLPHTILNNEWIDDVAWVIQCADGTEITKRMCVFGEAGRRYVQSIEVSVCVSNEYHVFLIDKESIEEPIIIEWTIGGIRDSGILFFNSNGRMISANYLQAPYGVMLLGKYVKIVEKNHVNVVYQSYPTDREGYRIASIEPLGRDAEIKYSTGRETFSIKARPQVQMSFNGKLLFSMPNDGRFKLFTEIPTLEIRIYEGAYSDGINLRIGKQVIDISRKYNDGFVSINLKQYEDELFSEYGTYSIRLYQNDNFIRQAEFSLMPKIKTNYSPIMKWPSITDKKSKKIFKFECLEDWQLEFDKCVIYNDEKNYIVECPEGVGSIYGRLKKVDPNDNFVCPFELPINPIEVEITSSDGEVQERLIKKVVRIGLSDIESNEYWVSMASYGEYRTRDYYIKLHSANGIEQEEQIHLTHEGGGNLNLACFYDSLRTCPLPAKLELWCDGSDSEFMPIMLVSDTVELNGKPGIAAGKERDFVTLSIQDDGKDITLRRFGVTAQVYHLLYANRKVSKNGERIGYPVNGRAMPGLYVIEADKEQSEFEFDDEPEILLTNGSSTLYISDRMNQNAIETVGDWIDCLIKEVIRAGITSDLARSQAFSFIGKLGELNIGELTEFDFEKMLALAYFAEAKCVDTKKKHIYTCMRAISKHVLDSKKRLELIRILAEVRASQEVFDKCIDYYDLFLFEPGSEDAKALAGKIENESTELSLLLLMGVDAPLRDTIYREKYRELIGRESIKSMLSVPDESDPVAIAEEQKKFFKEQSTCRVKVQLSNEISGYMKPIQDMIEVTFKSIFFNKAKKPDYGLYFDRIRYVDQYVNWYSNCHNRDGEMAAEVRNEMITAVKEYCKDLVQYVADLKMGSTKILFTRYDEALRYRTEKDVLADINANNHSRFFYLQGMAALMARLPKEARKYAWAVKAGEGFMLHASRVAPKISRRDIVMASTFIYLLRKEEKLCR